MDMYEKPKNQNTTSRRQKAAAAVTALLITGGIGLALERGASADNSFKTDIPIPTEVQPHVNYLVRSGDTESSIAAHFERPDDLDYENMLNAQLPKADQPGRILRPGEVLRVPEP
jgi:Tfp pilus assembly protein FimV